MSESTNRSGSTDTLLRRMLREERAENLRLHKALEAAQILNARLAESLDRVLISKFDPPLKPKPEAQPERAGFPDLFDVLSVDADAEFIERMQKIVPGASDVAN